jgi:hypothetical protein
MMAAFTVVGAALRAFKDTPLLASDQLPESSVIASPISAAGSAEEVFVVPRWEGFGAL